MPMRRDIRLVDVGIALWVVVWLVAGILVFQSIRQLEDGGRAIQAAGDGIDETSDALQRAARGLHETGDALHALDTLPFLNAAPGDAVNRTAEDVELLAERASRTADDARTTGVDAEDAAGRLAVVLGLAVAIGTTLPALLLYLLVRPQVADRLRTA